MSNGWQSQVEYQTLPQERYRQRWINDAKECQASAMKTFANGLQRDYDAVKAAVSLKWSNGQVEGQVNRLKNIKRQMYGRAGFELLKKKVLRQTG